MQLTNEMIEDIKKFAGAGFTPKETAFALGLKPAEFEQSLMDEESEASVAYFMGFFTNEFKVRESIMQMARSGSSPAQAQALKIINDTRKELTKGDYPGFAEQ